MLLFPADNNLPATDSATEGTLGGRTSSFIGQLFFDGYGSSAWSGGGNGLGPLNVTANGNDGNNNVNVAKIATLLSTMTNDNASPSPIYVKSSAGGLASGGAVDVWSPPGTDWRNLSRRAGIEKRVRDDGGGTFNNIATMPVLYYYAFLDMAAGDVLSKVTLPFYDTGVTRPLYRINVYMLNAPASMTRDQVNAALPAMAMGSYDANARINNIGGDAFRAMFFSKAKAVPSNTIAGQFVAPVRIGSWDETGDLSTTSMSSPVVVDFPNFTPRATSGKVWFIVTLAPYSIPTARQAAIQSALNSNLTTDPNPRFIGLGTHIYNTPIGTGYELDDGGKALVILDPANPRKSNHFGLGLNSIGQAGLQGAKFEGTKTVIL